MTALTIEFEGMRSSVDVSEEAAWAIVRFAAERAKTTPNGGADDDVVQSLPYGAQHNRGTTAERIREIASGILADGQFHPRKEIANACREAGIKVTNNLDSALARMERNKNMEGGVVFRNPEARPASSTADDESSPSSDDSPPVVESSADRIEVVGSLGDSDRWSS